jgi:hypothetical protein
LAREVAAHNVTINNLLPGQFDTERLKTTHAAAAAARGMETEAYRKAAISMIPARRFGDPSEFGAACAFLVPRRPVLLPAKIYFWMAANSPVCCD